MNTILTLILIVLIVGALLGFALSIVLVRAAIKKTLKLRKEKKNLLLMTKQLETAIAEVEKFQQDTVDRLIAKAVTEMETFLKPR
jgi:uncharacterized membrane protein